LSVVINDFSIIGPVKGLISRNELATAPSSQKRNWLPDPVLRKRTDHWIQFSEKELATAPSSPKKNWSLDPVFSEKELFTEPSSKKRTGNCHRSSAHLTLTLYIFDIFTFRFFIFDIFIFRYFYRSTFFFDQIRINQLFDKKIRLDLVLLYAVMIFQAITSKVYILEFQSSIYLIAFFLSSYNHLSRIIKAVCRVICIGCYLN
jgi:hypothetical protein